MTIDQLKARLREIADRAKIHDDNSTDVEIDHTDADEALVAFIDTIDPEVRVLFDKIVKWYA